MKLGGFNGVMRDGVFLLDGDRRLFVVFKIYLSVPIGIESDKLAGSVRQVRRRHRLLDYLIDHRQEVGDLGGTIRASGHLGHTVAVCCLYKENCALHGSAAVCVTLPNGEVWPLIVLQNDGAVLTGE